MLSKMDPASEDQADEGINISPLIDIVFILLLFFIVTSVFVQEAGVEVNKPESSMAQTLDRNSIFLGVTADGGIHYAGTEIGLYGIGPTLRRLEARPDQPVVIQADGMVTTQVLISVLDEIKATGALNVSVATLEK
jgi:biopolymer transport protein ExbD